MSATICTCRNCGTTHTKAKPNPFCSADCRKQFNAAKTKSQFSILTGESNNDHSNNPNSH